MPPSADNDDIMLDGDHGLGANAKSLADETIQRSMTVGEIVYNGFPDKKDVGALDSRSRRHVDDYPSNKPYTVAIKEVPVTAERLPYIPQDSDRLVDPGTARVNIAASKEAPNGTTRENWAENHKHQTVRSMFFAQGKMRR